nr:putative peptidoglycan-binding domain-containing protein [uncultured Campylobacter sp.]
MANFNEAFQILMRLEFSKPEDALDRNPTEKGWTFMGIYQDAHPHWKGWYEILGAVALGGNIEKISRALYSSENLRAQVRAFYKEAYWDRMRLDEVQSQIKGNEMFIFAVNVGIKPAVRVAQQLVGVVNDGIVGDQTIAAINRFDEERFDKQFDQAELQYYNGLIEKNQKFRIYANGWRNRALAV